RKLNDDSVQRRVVLLGSLPTAMIESQDPASIDEQYAHAPAILDIQKTHFDQDDQSIVREVQRIQMIESNNIYSHFFAWRNVSDGTPDYKIRLVVNATELHITKATKQVSIICRETPPIYAETVVPYIDSLPLSRIDWVYNILDHEAESEQILFEDPSPNEGYIIVPDFKWDKTSANALYLQAIVRNRAIRSIRDLRKSHLGMLKSIRKEAICVSSENWGVGREKLRMFIHYQPSYYHFHVHIVTLELEGFPGMTVGHAHLLDDVISLLETETDGVFERMSFTYALPAEHPLCKLIQARQHEIEI
ncbi:hypothetical protein FRC02_001999, partial [Tulasnella sp. 418]